MDFAETYEEAIDDLLYIINNKEITGEDYLKILLEYEDQLISAKAKGIVED